MGGSLAQVVEKAVSPSLFALAHRQLLHIGTGATYWKTFWFPWGEPTNTAEALALELRRHIHASPRIAGVEWWIGRMHTTRVALDFHHDRDLRLFEETGRLRHPLWSSVLFFNEVRGGSLFITDQRLVRRRGELVLSPTEPKDFATVRPSANRFAVFPGPCLHGVLDARDQVPTGRVPGPSGGARYSIVFNWWDRAPRDVPRWCDRRLYRELALPKAVKLKR